MQESSCKPTFWKLLYAASLTAMATGMGWGIRGQYGHETGAMIAGALGSLTLLLTLGSACGFALAIRAAALMTVGVGVGGSMTYGQTVGLTHDGELVGNWDAFRWGMLGLFIKGGIWIGYAATLFGIGLSRIEYRVRELTLLLFAMCVAMFAGLAFINHPFAPQSKVLPWLYFSDSWAFEPDGQLKPRPEVWGGLLAALALLWLYSGLVKRDKLAIRLGCAGFITGGCGFVGGQSVQAFHAWNPDLFTNGLLSWSSPFTSYFNWWNMMETTFGAIWGAGLAVALGMNLNLVDRSKTPLQSSAIEKPLIQVTLLAIHVGLLLVAEFSNLKMPYRIIELYTEFGLILVLIPFLGSYYGKLWSVSVMSLVVVLPIAGKTFKIMIEREQFPTDALASLTLLLPTLCGFVLLTWLINFPSDESCRKPIAVCLLYLATLFFWLNSAVFDFAWIWLEWTGRTPNQFIFMLCWACLAMHACSVLIRVQSQRRSHADSGIGKQPVVGD